MFDRVLIGKGIVSSSNVHVDLALTQMTALSAPVEEARFCVFRM
ncbi:hypothetical protein [Ruegeria sp. ANG-R]|nr:hypothetical protein [Ruegeria sp. ANG-R]